MKIKNLIPSPGWRAVYADGPTTRIADVAFFAVNEAYGSDEVVPMVPDHHDFATRLVSASNLGQYALLGPGEDVNDAWLSDLQAWAKR